MFYIFYSARQIAGLSKYILLDRVNSSGKGNAGNGREVALILSSLGKHIHIPSASNLECTSSFLKSDSTAIENILSTDIRSFPLLGKGKKNLKEIHIDGEASIWCSVWYLFPCR